MKHTFGKPKEEGVIEVISGGMGMPRMMEEDYYPKFEIEDPEIIEAIKNASYEVGDTFKAPMELRLYKLSESADGKCDYACLEVRSMELKGQKIMTSSDDEEDEFDRDMQEVKNKKTKPKPEMDEEEEY